MPDEFFFLTFGGLGVSLAGFAGLIHALDRSPNADSPITAWRIRDVVLGGFAIALSGLSVWPGYRLTGSVETTVRLSAAMLLVFYSRLWATQTRRGPAWPDEARRRLVRGVGSVTLVFNAVVIWLGSVGFLELLFVVAVSQPIGTFVRAVQDLHGRDLVDVTGAGTDADTG